jgi:hypothetical protein
MNSFAYTIDWASSAVIWSKHSAWQDGVVWCEKIVRLNMDRERANQNLFAIYLKVFFDGSVTRNDSLS